MPTLALSALAIAGATFVAPSPSGEWIAAETRDGSELRVRRSGSDSWERLARNVTSWQWAERLGDERIAAIVDGHELRLWRLSPEGVTRERWKPEPALAGTWLDAAALADGRVALLRVTIAGTPRTEFCVGRPVGKGTDGLECRVLIHDVDRMMPTTRGDLLFWRKLGAVGRVTVVRLDAPDWARDLAIPEPFAVLALGMPTGGGTLAGLMQDRGTGALRTFVVRDVRAAVVAEPGESACLPSVENPRRPAIHVGTRRERDGVVFLLLETSRGPEREVHVGADGSVRCSP